MVSWYKMVTSKTEDGSCLKIEHYPYVQVNGWGTVFHKHNF